MFRTYVEQVRETSPQRSSPATASLLRDKLEVSHFALPAR
jgi:hypothetical protein